MIAISPRKSAQAAEARSQSIRECAVPKRRGESVVRGLLRRRRRQGGQEIVEFALVALLFIPLMLGGFVTGMGLIRSIQVNHVAANLANIYIHGGDFSSYNMQLLAQRLGQGLNLQIGSSFTGNAKSNTSNSGDAVVMVSQIMYVGATTSPNCVSVGGSNCTNATKFVFTQRIKFGNGSVATSTTNTLGDPTTTAIGNNGVVTSPVTDAGAQLPAAGQSAMQSLWQNSSGGRTPLQDGQAVYVVEVYSQSPGLSIGNASVGGQYARYFF